MFKTCLILFVLCLLYQTIKPDLIDEDLAGRTLILNHTTEKYYKQFNELFIRSSFCLNFQYSPDLTTQYLDCFNTTLSESRWSLRQFDPNYSRSNYRFLKRIKSKYHSQPVILSPSEIYLKCIKENYEDLEEIYKFILCDPQPNVYHSIKSKLANCLIQYDDPKLSNYYYTYFHHDENNKYNEASSDHRVIECRQNLLNIPEYQLYEIKFWSEIYANLDVSVKINKFCNFLNYYLGEKKNLDQVLESVGINLFMDQIMECSWGQLPRYKQCLAKYQNQSIDWKISHTDNWDMTCNTLGDGGYGGMSLKMYEVSSQRLPQGPQLITFCPKLIQCTEGRSAKQRRNESWNSQKQFIIQRLKLHVRVNLIYKFNLTMILITGLPEGLVQVVPSQWFDTHQI